MSSAKDICRAPIGLFVYNRPWHTQKTVEALLENESANESELHIFSDASRTIESNHAVQEVRAYIRNIRGFKKVDIVERERNFGLANSIIDGVTTLCTKYERVIVLEDDLVTSPYFLRYMNDALDVYEHEEQVISVHGYMYPVPEPMPETFLLRGADCWGWGTWKRGWDLFEQDSNWLIDQVKKRGLVREFNYDGAYDLAAMLVAQTQGKVDSWAIRWYASAFLENRLTLYPGKSLVRNIGTDSSGTHCGTTDSFSGELGGHRLAVERMPITENLKARAAVSHYLRSTKPSVLRRVYRKLKNVTTSVRRLVVQD